MQDKTLVTSEGEDYVDLDYDKKKLFFSEASLSSETASAIDSRSALVEALIAAGSDVAGLNVSGSSWVLWFASVFKRGMLGYKGVSQST